MPGGRFVTLMLACVLTGGILSAMESVPATCATVKLALPATRAESGAPAILHFENLVLPPHSSGIVRVFADLPTASGNTSPDDPHYLGYFTVLAKTSDEAARGIQRKSATLDISTHAERLAGKTDVTLTLVALGGVPPGTPPVNTTRDRVIPTVGRVFLADK
jgi:hypothetical protein